MEIQPARAEGFQSLRLARSGHHMFPFGLGGFREQSRNMLESHMCTNAMNFVLLALHVCENHQIHGVMLQWYVIGLPKLERKVIKDLIRRDSRHMPRSQSFPSTKQAGFPAAFQKGDAPGLVHTKLNFEHHGCIR